MHNVGSADNWRYAQRHYEPRERPVEARVASMRLRGPFVVVEHFALSERFSVYTTRHCIEPDWGSLHETEEALAGHAERFTHLALARENHPLTYATLKVVRAEKPLRYDVYVSE